MASWPRPRALSAVSPRAVWPRQPDQLENPRLTPGLPTTADDTFVVPPSGPTDGEDTDPSLCRELSRLRWCGPTTTIAVSGLAIGGRRRNPPSPDSGVRMAGPGPRAQAAGAAAHRRDRFLRRLANGAVGEHPAHHCSLSTDRGPYLARRDPSRMPGIPGVERNRRARLLGSLGGTTSRASSSGVASFDGPSLARWGPDTRWSRRMRGSIPRRATPSPSLPAPVDSLVFAEHAGVAHHEIVGRP